MSICKYVIPFLSLEINQQEKKSTKICQCLTKTSPVNETIRICEVTKLAEKYLQHFDLVRLTKKLKVLEYDNSFFLFGKPGILQRLNTACKCSREIRFKWTLSQKAFLLFGGLGSITISVCLSWKSNNFRFFPVVHKNVQIN